MPRYMEKKNAAESLDVLAHRCDSLQTQNQSHLYIQIQNCSYERFIPLSLIFSISRIVCGDVEPS